MTDLRITSRRPEDRIVTVQEGGSSSLLNLGALRGLVAECKGMSDGANVYVSRLSDSADYVGLKWVGRIEVRGAELQPLDQIRAELVETDRG